jgi:uncharacterized membrane protein YdjX (TVP38/TMEM64 family)
MTLLAAASGYAFPYWLAVIATWLGGVLGAAVVYLVAHRLLRRTVEASCLNRSLFLRRLFLYARSKGWRGVLLMRLPYVPFVTMNYVLSIGGISFKHYLLATAVGILPGSALFTYVGHTVKDIAAVVNGTEALSPIAVATTAGGSTLLTGLFIAMVVVVRRRMVAHAAMMDERVDGRVDRGEQEGGPGGGGRGFAHGGARGEEGGGFEERPGRSLISPLPCIRANIPSQMYPSMSKVDFVVADKGDDEYHEFIEGGGGGDGGGGGGGSGGCGKGGGGGGVAAKLGGRGARGGVVCFNPPESTSNDDDDDGSGDSSGGIEMGTGDIVAAGIDTSTSGIILAELVDTRSTCGAAHLPMTSMPAVHHDDSL